MNWNQFEKAKKKFIYIFLNKDWGGSIEIELAKFLNDLEPRHYDYLIGEWKVKQKKESFLQILTQNFLDYIDDNRDNYLKLIQKRCPKDLWREILQIIKESSFIPYVYEGLT